LILRRPVYSYRFICGLIISLLTLTGPLAPSAQAEVTDSLSLIEGQPQQVIQTEVPPQQVVQTEELPQQFIQADSVFTPLPDSMVYKPNPTKAIWYSALFPGLGQLYNKRYWKLPVVAAGVVGISYAIGWNSKYYVAYTNAYRDISDTNPQTTSYLDLLPPGTTTFNTGQLTTILKNRQQKYRRSRDLSYIGAVGLYIICILDAYVDAELYDFDISPDLSLSPLPTPQGYGGARAVELSLSFRF
jgi:hypothetical protein